MGSAHRKHQLRIGPSQPGQRLRGRTHLVLHDRAGHHGAGAGLRDRAEPRIGGDVGSQVDRVQAGPPGGGCHGECCNLVVGSGRHAHQDHRSARGTSGGIEGCTDATQHRAAGRVLRRHVELAAAPRRADLGERGEDHALGRRLEGGCRVGLVQDAFRCCGIHPARGLDEPTHQVLGGCLSRPLGRLRRAGRRRDGAGERLRREIHDVRGSLACGPSGLDQQPHGAQPRDRFVVVEAVPGRRPLWGDDPVATFPGAQQRHAHAAARRGFTDGVHGLSMIAAYKVLTSPRGWA